MTLKLSSIPDGFGFFYGFYGDDCRQVNIRWEKEPPAWHVYVGGEKVGSRATFNEARAHAVQWIHTNP